MTNDNSLFEYNVYSDSSKKTLGGPFRANEEGVDYYVYIFANPFKIHLLDVNKVKNTSCRLKNSGKYDKKYIPNKGYKTKGYPFPISEFKDCIVSEATFINGDILNKRHKSK